MAIFNKFITFVKFISSRKNYLYNFPLKLKQIFQKKSYFILKVNPISVR